jgi:tetrapyrrole methylase family protein/MazG family protein
MRPPRVVVVGLGPAGPELINHATADALAAVEHHFLRTTRHPAAVAVADARSFDDLYEESATFADVYRRIADELAAAAAVHDQVLYAVPGSPWVLERSVRHLLDDSRIEVEVLPALSFLDLAYARLRLDPVESGLRLVDGHDFAASAAGERGPLLVAHVHDEHVLSAIKLAAEDLDPATPVTVLQRLGGPDEAVFTVPWAELDRTFAPDHLTALYIERLAAPVGGELVRFHQLVRTLREHCPWDREQTHSTLVPYLVEEAYEVIDAVEALDAEQPQTDEALIEELGDLLFQIAFHAAIAEEQGRFTLAEVADGIHGKLVRRHPHVFGDVEVTGADDVVRNWDAIKQQEKGRGSAFEGIPRHLPALLLAHTVQRKAAKLGFDAPDVTYFVPKVTEELDEVVGAADAEARVAEIGDLLFAVVNVARHLGVEPEQALRGSVAKFRRRVAAVQQLAEERGVALSGADLATLDALWDEAKAATTRDP